jgi:hypothetical protein
VASQSGHLVVVDRLLQNKRVDPAANNNCAIRMASQKGHFAVVNRLLQDKRVDPAATNDAAIKLASENGHASVVARLMKDKRVNLTVYDNASLRISAHKCHTDVAEVLLNDPRIDAAAIHRLSPAAFEITLPSNPGHEMLHLLSHTVQLPFPVGSCIIKWKPLIRRHRYHQLLCLETLIASKWHKEGEHRDVSEDVIAKYVRSFACWIAISTRPRYSQSQSLSPMLLCVMFALILVRCSSAAAASNPTTVVARVRRMTGRSVQEEAEITVLI